MFAVIFICENFFLRIAGKITKIAKIRARKNFVPHGMRFWQRFFNITGNVLYKR